MCLDLITKLLKSFNTKIDTPTDNGTIIVIGSDIPIVQPYPVLPHPEEPMNPLQTMENTDINKVVEKWLYDWGVPVIYYPFWQGIDIQLSLEGNVYIGYPAITISETKQIWVRSEWTNPGIIAHECAHISYSLLDITDKIQFEIAFNEEVKTDEMLKFLWSQNTYMRTNIVESHADCYRFLGASMPRNLRTFYPNLF